MGQTFVLVVFCSFFVNYSVQSERCTTPNDLSGQCVSIYDCEILRRKLTGNNEEKKFLKESNCGWVGVLNPKVCCRTHAPEVQDKFQPENPLLPNRTFCGFQEEPDKIINGEDAHITDSPWSALLVHSKNGRKYYNCGGVLISDRYVLTAAHCKISNLNQGWVRFGEFDLSKPRDCTPLNMCSEFSDVEVEAFIRHPHFQGNDVEGWRNDIALIRLIRTVRFSRFVQPICLPRDSSERSGLGSELLIAGWGATDNNKQEQNSAIKQKIQIPVMSLSECQKKFNDKNIAIILNDLMICAGGVRDKTTCKGDSGEALVANSKEVSTQHYVEGILSYSLKRCHLKMPTVFTRVSEFLPWINENIKP